MNAGLVAAVVWLGRVKLSVTALAAAITDLGRALELEPMTSRPCSAAPAARQEIGRLEADLDDADRGGENLSATVCAAHRVERSSTCLSFGARSSAGRRPRGRPRDGARPRRRRGVRQPWDHTAAARSSPRGLGWRSNVHPSSTEAGQGSDGPRRLDAVRGERASARHDERSGDAHAEKRALRARVHLHRCSAGAKAGHPHVGPVRDGRIADPWMKKS